MTIVQRYFRITEKKHLEHIDKYFVAVKEFKERLNDLKAEIAGAENFWVSQNDWRIIGIDFGCDGPPVDTRKYFRQLKKHREYWYPKKNMKYNKELLETLNTFKKEVYLEEILKDIGIKHHTLCLAGFSNGYSACVFGSDKNGWFACIPWTDYPKEELEQYKLERDAGTRYTMNYEYILNLNIPESWLANEVSEFEATKNMGS